MTETVSTAVERRDDGAGALITKYRADFATVLPSHLPADQWVRLTAGVLRRNPQLARVAQHNPGSFLAAALNAARLGLVIGDTYHLIPFGNEIVGIADYTGLIELVYRAGAVASVKCEVVYSNDVFEYEPGVMDRPIHRPDWFGDRGQMLGAYAYAVLKDGSTSQVVVRSAREIAQVQAVSRSSKAKDSPWTVWPDRMWRKTVLRELTKFVPSSAEYRQEAARADAAAAQVAESNQLPAASVDDTVDGEFVEEWPETAQPGGGE